MLSFKQAQLLKHPREFSEREVEIMQALIPLFAGSETDNMSMRKLSKRIDISASVLYHYFSDKDELLWQMFRYASYTLGQLRQQAKSDTDDAQAAFRKVIAFQFEQSELIVAILKFYLLYREAFAQSKHKTLPNTASLHIQEVIELGIKQGRYKKDAVESAKIIVHSINGYVLEHFPYQLEAKQKKELITELVEFFEMPLLKSSIVRQSNK